MQEKKVKKVKGSGFFGNNPKPNKKEKKAAWWAEDKTTEVVTTPKGNNIGLPAVDKALSELDKKYAPLVGLEAHNRAIAEIKKKVDAIDRLLGEYRKDVIRIQALERYVNMHNDKMIKVLDAIISGKGEEIQNLIKRELYTRETIRNMIDNKGDGEPKSGGKKRPKPKPNAKK